MIDKFLLFPYYAVLKLRNHLYDKGLLKSQRAEVPTICVGNIAAGGTGKTPHTEMILRELLDSGKWSDRKIAVLSRGYKRESSGFQQVTPGGSAAAFGDEPLQIKKKFPGVTVAVDKDRIEGCRFLVHPEELRTDCNARMCREKDMPASDIIVLDDAFQYRRLRADLNVILVDYSHPLHKDHLLPLGRLRDLPERIEEADIIIVTKCPGYLDESARTDCAAKLGVKDYSPDSCCGTSAGGKVQPVLFSYMEYCPLQPVFDVSDPRYIYSKKMILFTGIAKDKPLRKYLSDNYRIVRRFRFPDHHRFVFDDLQKIRLAVDKCPTAILATTEKDAQRILDCTDLGLPLRERMFVVPIKARFLTEEERNIFRSKLLALQSGGKT